MMLPAARTKRDAFLAAIGSRPLIMGVLNVTPDSFFDGGRFVASRDAIDHIGRMIADGCDIVDIGGELTRPGANPVGGVRAVVTTFDVPMSIDTTKAAVAAHALSYGVVLVNDVWGLQKDPRMADVVAGAEAAGRLTHNRAGTEG